MTDATTYNNDWLETQTVIGFVQHELKTYVFVECEIHGDEAPLMIVDIERKALYASNYWGVPDREDFAFDMEEGEALIPLTHYVPRQWGLI